MRLHVGHVILDLWPKVVRDHGMHRVGAKTARAAELTAVEQHLSKAQVVADGGKRAGSAAVKLRWRVEELDGLRLAPQRGIGKSPGETRALRLREVEWGIFHAERLPHIPTQALAPSLLAHPFPHPPPHAHHATPP